MIPESPTNEVVVSYSRRRRSALLFSSVPPLVVVLLQMLLGAAICSLSRAFVAQAAPPNWGAACRRLMQGDVRSMYPGGERRSDRNS